MKIDVRIEPSCTWVLDGDSFYCTHDEVAIESYTIDYMTFDGPDQYEEEGYVCAECGEPLEGSPAADRADYIAEMEADRMRDE